MSVTGGQPLPLSLDRLFDTPGLSGPVPAMARYAPDGRSIAWLRPADDDFERLDLWLCDLTNGSSRCLMDARALGEERSLSDEEKARRERLRVFTGGIVEFEWAGDGKAILFTLAGCLYLQRLTPGSVPEPLTEEEEFITDVRVGPKGLIGFVQDRNLWLRETDGELRQLTTEGGGSVSCGLADFIAQEEMHRFDGYFFAPDGRRVAFLKVDEAPIPLSHRYEIDAGGLSVHAQHYPYAGGPNARVELGIIDLDDGSISWLQWSGADSEYLARLAWRPDGSGLVIQRQSRLQQRLELVDIDLAGNARILHTETSDTWINLNDDFRLLRDGRHALWSSEQQGLRRLHRLNLDSGELTPLTPADGMVLRLIDVDEANGQVFVEGWFELPTQRHLYRVDLAGEAPPERLTQAHGSHQTQIAPDFATFVDRREHLTQPPCLEVRDLGGSLVAELLANRTDTPAHPYHPFLSGHRQAQLGELTAADGQRLFYRLTPPAESHDGPRPVIVSVYGGPGVQRVQDAWPPLIHQYFARRGWGVFELDNRGSGNRGRDFERPIHGHLGAAEVADQMLGLDFLATLGWVDMNRIAVFGHSYGGYMALMCLAQHPDRFRAAVSVAPVTDWLLYDTHYTERYLGHPDASGEGYAASAVEAWLPGFARARPGSLLLMHGMADDNVLFTHTSRLMHALQENGVLFDLMAYPGAKHGLAGRRTGLHRFRVIEAFLARHLEGDEDG
ncbi:MAG: alpha/beta fold hydrolase [Gammaproteobacteria bacterium]|nr:alpha/beta fold hydrolase [Gammaproteobacteria bacterium]